VLATLAKGLIDSGYDVLTADSGEVALAMAMRQPFDLAILDIRMPGLSGIETARRLRTGYDVPALFLSAYGEPELVEQAASEGGLGYVVKPVDVPQLVPAIEAALARARDLKLLAKGHSQLEQALDSGRQTSIAIGILMERRGLTEQSAFEMLRATARKRRRKLEEVSRELVEAMERLNGI
jgi:response regulator NasT